MDSLRHASVMKIIYFEPFWMMIYVKFESDFSEEKLFILRRFVNKTF